LDSLLYTETYFSMRVKIGCLLCSFIFAEHHLVMGKVFHLFIRI